MQLNRYTIIDLGGLDQYMVSMKMSQCFNDDGPCDLPTMVLDKVILAKPLCKWNMGFKDPCK